MNLEQLLDGIRADGNIDALTDLSNILDCCIDKYGERDSNGVKFQHLLEIAICITVMDRVGNHEDAAKELLAFSNDFKAFAKVSDKLFRAFTETFDR